MLANLLQTDANWVLTILRVVLGIVIFAHGAQKMLGWFGGYGFSGTMGFFTKTHGHPRLRLPSWRFAPSFSAAWA